MSASRRLVQSLFFSLATYCYFLRFGGFDFGFEEDLLVRCVNLSLSMEYGIRTTPEY